MRLQIDRLTLMVYEAAVIGGPLSGLCEFDLATRQARILDRQLMGTLFGKQQAPGTPSPSVQNWIAAPPTKP